MRVTQAHFFLFYSTSFLTTFCDPMNWIHNLQMGCDPQYTNTILRSMNHLITIH